MRGLRLAGLEDLLAAKPGAILGRTALRDYFDLMAIETSTAFTADQGLRFHCERYAAQDPEQSMRFILDALTSVEDLGDDRELVDLRDGHRVRGTDMAAYWRPRVRDIVEHLDLGR